MQKIVRISSGAAFEVLAEKNLPSPDGKVFHVDKKVLILSIPTPYFFSLPLHFHAQPSEELRTVPVGAGRPGERLTRNVNRWSKSAGQEPCQLHSSKR